MALASTHRNLLAYAQAHAAQTCGKVTEPARLIVPMLDQFMASDRAFVRGRKGRVAFEPRSTEKRRPR